MNRLLSIEYENPFNPLSRGTLQIHAKGVENAKREAVDTLASLFECEKELIKILQIQETKTGLVLWEA